MTVQAFAVKTLVGFSTFFFGERESFLVFITGYKGTAVVISFRLKGATGEFQAVHLQKQLY